MCTESIPAPPGAGTPSHSLGHSQDEFNFQDVAGSPVKEQRMCSLPSVAKLYCGSLLPTAEPKDLKDSDLGPSKPCSAPREGRALLSSPLPEEGTGTTWDCKECAGLGHSQCCPCLSQALSIFMIWGNFLLGLLYIYYREFLLFKFFKKAKLQMVLLFFFPRHLWVLTRYIIYG